MSIPYPCEGYINYLSSIAYILAVFPMKLLVMSIIVIELNIIIMKRYLVMKPQYKGYERSANSLQNSEIAELNE